MSLTRITWPAEIEGGKLTVPDEDGFKRALSCLAGRVLITVEYVKDKRSERQNRYYFGVLIKILADELGYSTDEMHEALKWKFLKIHETELPTVRSTTTLDIQEFSDYCEKIKQFAATELNIVLPDPNQKEWL